MKSYISVIEVIMVFNFIDYLIIYTYKFIDDWLTKQILYAKLVDFKI